MPAEPVIPPATERFLADLVGAGIASARSRPFRLGPDWSLEPRRHGDHVIYLVSAGSIEWTLPSGPWRQQPGWALWIAPGVTHAARQPARQRRLAVRILRCSLRCDGRDLVPPWATLSCRSTAQLAAAFDGLSAALHRQGRWSAWLRRAALLGFAGEMLCAAGGDVADRPESRMCEALDRLAAATPAALARRLGVSVGELRRMVRRSQGCSTRTWLMRRRLEPAADLLAHGGSVAEAADAVGYASLSSFSRAFASAHRMPPGAYRRRMWGQDRRWTRQPGRSGNDESGTEDRTARS